MRRDADVFLRSCRRVLIEAWHTVGWYHVHGGSMILRIIDGLGFMPEGC
jgi:hypothetical protein